MDQSSSDVIRVDTELEALLRWNDADLSLPEVPWFKPSRNLVELLTAPDIIIPGMCNGPLSQLI